MFGAPMAGDIEQIRRGVTVDTARLKALRRAARMTQSELADRLGLTVDAVSKWERGVARPDRKHLVAIAQVLNAPITEFVAGDDLPVPPPAEATVDERLSWLEAQMMPWLMRHDRFVRDSFPELAGEISRLDERIEALAGSVADAVRELRQAADEHRQRAAAPRRRDI